MKKSKEPVLYGFILIGAFAAGLTWKPLYESMKNAKEYLECLSFIATIVACAVAVSALTAWKAQFKHAERFNAIKGLKDASLGLLHFRGYIETLIQRCLYMQANGNVASAEIEAEVERKKEKWLNELHDYNKAWGTARAFLTEAELSAIKGSAPVYVKLSLDLPLRIITLYANNPSREGQMLFLNETREITVSLKQLYASTVARLELMLADFE